MKTITALCVLLLAGCASMPRHCVRNAALAGGLAATGGYFLARESANRERILETTVNQDGDLINTVRVHKSGALYENREAVAVGTGIIVGAFSMARCAR